MKKSVIITSIVLMTCLFMTHHSVAQKKEISGKKVEKSRGESKYVIPSGDLVKAKPEKSRGESCCLAFDNYTGYYIDIWIDDVYSGRLSPWQESYSLCVAAGWTKYYAKTIGGTYEWADQGQCSDNWIFNLK